jgi:multiple sugar transport system ATP-binding protein
MGRAIVREPAAYLMDEPLSNLDAKLRVAMRAELARLHERLATTTVYVTHDQIEAMTLGQRVTVMRNGLLQQIGPPQELYREPANLFVAAFIGSPSMNLVEATVDSDTVEFAGFRLPLAPDRRPARPGKVILGIRPDNFEDIAYAETGLPTIDVQVAVLEELGSEAHVIFPLDAQRVEAEELREAQEDEDAQLLAEGGSMFTARVDSRTAARTGKAVTLAVNPAGFHFFDPDTGQTLRAREGELAVTA